MNWKLILFLDTAAFYDTSTHLCKEENIPPWNRTEIKKVYSSSYCAIFVARSRIEGLLFLIVLGVELWTNMKAGVWTQKDKSTQMLRCRRQLRFIKGECERMYGVYETQLFCIPLQSHSKNIVCVVFFCDTTRRSIYVLVYNDFLTGKNLCIVECDSLSLNPTVNYRAGIFSANMRHRHDHSKHCLCWETRQKAGLSVNRRKSTLHIFLL